MCSNKDSNSLLDPDKILDIEDLNTEKRDLFSRTSKIKIFALLIVFLLLSPIGFATYYTSWRAGFLSCHNSECELLYNYELKENLTYINKTLSDCSNGCDIMDGFVKCYYKETYIIYKNNIFELNDESKLLGSFSWCLDETHAKHNSPCHYTGSLELLLFGNRLILAQNTIDQCDVSYWYVSRYYITQADNFSKENSFSYYNEKQKKNVSVHYEIVPIKIRDIDATEILTDNPELFQNFLNTYSEENKFIIDSYFYITKKLSNEISTETNQLSNSADRLDKFIKRDFIDKLLGVTAFYKEKENVSTQFFNNIKRTLILKEIKHKNDEIRKNRKNRTYDFYIDYSLNWEIKKKTWNYKQDISLPLYHAVDCGLFCNQLSDDTILFSKMLDNKIDEFISKNDNNELFSSKLIKQFESEESFVAIIISTTLSFIAIMISSIFAIISIVISSVSIIRTNKLKREFNINIDMKKVKSNIRSLKDKKKRKNKEQKK